MVERWAPVAAMVVAGAVLNMLINWPQSPQAPWPW